MSIIIGHTKFLFSDWEPEIQNAKISHSEVTVIMAPGKALSKWHLKYRCCQMHKADEMEDGIPTLHT